MDTEATAIEEREVHHQRRTREQWMDPAGQPIGERGKGYWLAARQVKAPGRG